MSEQATRTPLRRTSRATLTQQVAQRLLDMIRSGHYKPGDRLPTENDLVAQLGVGRSCVREAMQWLTMAGAVDVRPRRGAIVRKIDAERLNVLTSFPSLLELEVLQELGEVRRLLEPEVARLAAERCAPEDVQKLAAYQRALETAIAAGNSDAMVAADVGFHNVIAEAAHNIVLRKMMAGVHDLLLESRRMTFRAPGAIERTLASHRQILEAIAAHDGETAREAMRGHLQRSRNDLTAVGEGTALPVA